jgi:hypothetical protein
MHLPSQWLARADDILALDDDTLSSGGCCSALMAARFKITSNDHRGARGQPELAIFWHSDGNIEPVISTDEIEILNPCSLTATCQTWAQYGDQLKFSARSVPNAVVMWRQDIRQEVKQRIETVQGRIDYLPRLRSDGRQHPVKTICFLMR